jgi:hypothetical protein
VHPSSALSPFHRTAREGPGPSSADPEVGVAARHLDVPIPPGV